MHDDGSARSDGLGSPRTAEALLEVAVEQFTVHAESFATSAVINDAAALDALLALCAPLPGRRVLDVACGPGIVSCALAAAGASVVGVDATPTMLALARQRAEHEGVAARTRFEPATMEALPFADGSFDLVVSRYALHHAADPAVVAGELSRVAGPSGAVVVVDFDAGPDAEASAAYDEAERWRDPSHVRNLPAEELRSLFSALGWREARRGAYRVAADLDVVLTRSHGVDHAKVRELFEASLDSHRLGVDARRDGERIVFAYPIVGFRFAQTKRQVMAPSGP